MRSNETKVGKLNSYFSFQDGKLYVKESVDEPSIEYSADKYCFDNFVTDNTETKNTSVKLNGLICYRPKDESNHYGVSASCKYFRLYT